MERGGGGGIRHLATLHPEDIVFALDRSVAKVAEELQRHPDKQFTIVTLTDDPRQPTLRPDQALMAQYLERELDTLRADTVMHMRQNTDEIDKTGHPTEHATKEIMQTLSAEYGDDIVRNEYFITTDRCIYVRVPDMPRTRAVSSPLRSLPHLPLRLKPRTTGARSGRSS